MQYIKHEFDFVVIGAGMAGYVAAITASRNGLRTALINDRPVLGGCASKEIQIPPVGAHYGGGTYAYFRESGFMEELLLENLYRNPGGSPEIWNMMLNEFAYRENNLEVFINTPICKVNLNEDLNTIDSVEGFTTPGETWHSFRGKYFSDCTGDGTVGALSGASFMRGCEAKSKYNESLATDEKQQREMGCSIRFKAKDTKKPVEFVLPSYIKYHFTKENLSEMRDIDRDFKNWNYGGFWWVEIGGFQDTIHESSDIHKELEYIIFALWDYLKNRSSLKDELETFELDWIGTIAGKRENRRFVGDYILTQNDIDKQKYFKDAIAYGGWGFDDHPPKGIFDSNYPSFHVHHAGPYNVPLRCLYSKDIDNLFFAGRNISVSHIALTSTRVIMTCSQFGEAVGAAVVICDRYNIKPKQLYQDGTFTEVQKLLQKSDHTIIGLRDRNKAKNAKVVVSSILDIVSLENSIKVELLSVDRMTMIPISDDTISQIDILLDAHKKAALVYNFYSGPANGSTYPDKKILGTAMKISKGKKQWISIDINSVIEKQGWHFLELIKNTDISLHYCNNAPVGFKMMKKVEKDPIRPVPYTDWRFNCDLFSLPGLCLKLEQDLYSGDNLINGYNRPTNLPNIWCSRETDFVEPEWIELTWDDHPKINEIQLIFDGSIDSKLSAFSSDGNSKVSGYSKNILPSIVKDYKIFVLEKCCSEWREIADIKNNYQKRCVHKIEPINISRLRIEVLDTNGINRAQIYSINVY